MGRRVVLVVEDEPEIADALRQYLEKDGYTVALAGDESPASSANSVAWWG